LEAGIALAPSVPLSMIEDMLEDIDFIHIMAVNPGFSGQPLMPAMIKRIAQARRMLNEKGLKTDIEVDGCVSYDNAGEFIKNGATTLVLGPYSCFDKEIGINAALKRMKNAVNA
jgi:ribulose-phosphate 3-epimerase